MRMIGVICGVLAAGPALAHPHVFIDATVEVILNERNEATGIRIGWTYDELYSLYIIGDLGLDPDWDGKLTPEEVARLSGFDMNWDQDFAGDTHAALAGAGLELSRPMEFSASYAGGKITSTHLRVFDAPVPLAGGELVIRAYDPGYYVAYAIPGSAVLTGGEGCSAGVVRPDPDAAQEKLLAALAGYAPDEDPEAEFPEVGANFADEVRVTCAAG